MKDKPSLYLLCGLPGSGKSFWAKQHENENKIRISHDEEFFVKFGKEDTGKKHDEYSKILERELFERIKKPLEENKDVILDYGFWKKADRDLYKEEFENLANIKVIYFDVPKEKRYERVLNRDKKDDHDLNLEALQIFEEKFEAPGVDEDCDRIFI